MVKKKDKKAEKSKVKLKTSLKSKTKFLPKGGNVTKTDFKIKAIVIQEQLRAKNLDEPLSKRKLSFKELLTRLNHHNVNVKSGACEGLSELIGTTSQELIETQLHLLLQGISKLLLDKETKPRRHAIKLISDILAKVSVLKLEPFFEILMSHTACAMTHLDVNIQEDSLLIIDAFLKHIPSLITKHHMKLFPNFLRLISKLRSASNPSRTLTVNLQGSATSIKWRINVLSRLEGILKAIISEKVILTSKSQCKTVLASTACYVPLYSGIEESFIDFYRFGGTQVINAKNSVSDDVDVLIPLLYETWVEVLPQKQKISNEENTIIDGDAASILSCTMGIFHLLWKLLQNSDQHLKKRLLSKDNRKFFNHVLVLFPYQQKDVQVSKVKDKKAKLLHNNTDLKCVNQNLQICCMFSILHKNILTTTLLSQATDVISYINMCLVNRNYVKGENINQLISILAIIFFENFSLWNKRQLNVQQLLDSVIHFYGHTKLSNDIKVELIKLLTKVVHTPILKSSVKYKDWLSALPKLLCEPTITIEVVDCLSILSRQASKKFLSSLLSLLPDVFGNLHQIEIIGDYLYPPHFKIVNMFVQIPSYEDKHLDFIENFVMKNPDSKLSRHIFNTFKERDRGECFLY